jgi:hypothetical protein
MTFQVNLSEAKGELNRYAKLLDFEWEERARLLDGSGIIAQKWQAEQYELKVKAGMVVFEELRQRLEETFKHDSHYTWED